MTTVPLVIYSLKCGHAVQAPATLVSGSLLCPWHDSFAPIDGVVIHEWRAKCHTCIFARWAGTSKANAEIFANGHVRRNHLHHVVSEYVINPEAKRTKDKFDAWHMASE